MDTNITDKRVASLTNRFFVFTSFIGFITVLFLFTGIFSCSRSHLPAQSTGWHDYVQVNLVADTTGFNASRTDAGLGNPVGIAFSTRGTIWISCNHTGQSVIYDTNGNEVFAPVAMPHNGIHKGAAPNGMIYNTTPDFIVNGRPAICIYSTEQGTVSIWNTGDTTVTVASRAAVNAVYKGIAMANDGTGNFLYAADFFNGRIDVFDKTFNLTTNKPFLDPGMPPGYAPFNIRNIGGKLFVCYAKRNAGNGDEETGMGEGFIDVFNPGGILVKRFASRGTLNAPWGIAMAGPDFGQGANAILVANYGDGHINVFDTSGAFWGPLENGGIPLAIDGLWDITFSATGNTQLYFTAGPNREKNGLFGYLQVK